MPLAAIKAPRHAQRLDFRENKSGTEALLESSLPSDGSASPVRRLARTIETVNKRFAIHRFMTANEILLKKKQSLLDDIHFLTTQESDIREQIRELAIQAVAIQKEIRAHEQEIEAVNKMIQDQ
jgi:septal ring factor EnvC (AmiA/AmiB activator)